jgi:hypothetical protein
MTTAQRSLPLAAVLLLLVAADAGAHAQALPAAEASPISTGFTLPHAAGTLNYAVSASESVATNRFGNSGTSAYSNLSGDLAFITDSQRDPFSMVFSGGRSWTTSSQSSYSFLNLAMSQVVNLKRWNFVLSDSVSYMPGTASTGLSGVAGVGDLGAGAISTSEDTGQGVLTGYSTRVSNSSSLSIQRQITGKTSIYTAGTYSTTRFLSDSTSNGDNPGLDSSDETASLGLSHRIDARNTIGTGYAFTRSTYTGNNYGIPEPGFSSQTAIGQYTHQFTRKLGFSASAGPEWTTVDSTGSSTSTTLFADISAAYAGQFSNAALSYRRSTNGGFGVVGGSLSDSVVFSVGRTFNRVWRCSATADYTRTVNLSSTVSLPFTFHTEVAGGQVSRALGRSFSAFASYSVETQSNQGAAATIDLFNGLTQVVGFGLTYAPASIHLGHQ